jgi:hypothetical protein
MSVFDDDFAVSDELFAEAFGGTVSYYRGAESVDLTAEVVISQYEIDSPDGQTPNSWQVWDWTISAADLVITGISASALEPRRNDQIRRTLDSGTVEIFHVLPLGNKPCFESANPERTQLLVHTKFIGTTT